MANEVVTNQDVYFAGLLSTSENTLFPEAISLLPYCDDIIKLLGICMRCGSDLGNYSMFKGGEKKETIVLKKSMPTQAIICNILGIKSPKTYRAHLNYLIEAGYVVDNKTEYYLPNQEEIFFLIPLETLKFLNDCLKEQVIKIYIYLGQRWKYK